MKIRIDAPAEANRYEIAQAVLGPNLLLKAEHLKHEDRTFRHHPLMRDGADAWVTAYEKLLARIIHALREYAEKNIVLGTLGKAQGYRPLASSHDLAELRRIIADFHLAFVAGQVGPEYISHADVQRLIDAGILPQDLAYTWHPGVGELPPEAARRIEDAYNYGFTLAHLRPEPGVTMPAAVEVRRPKLTDEERHARDWASRSAAETIVGLGNRVAQDFTTIAIEADGELRQKFREAIREELDGNIERRDAWRKLASDLGHRTGDWARDFRRIAATEKQNAMQEGLAAGLIKREGSPKTIYVAKIPAPEACDDCVRLHLTAGPGSPPRIHTLAELTANGTNVGRKHNAWRAVVGPVHPWCSCALVHVPPGWGFDDDGTMVPLKLKRAELLDHDLRKSMMLYGGLPKKGIVIHVSDPAKHAAVEKVVAETPSWLFDRDVGITYVTVDHPRVQNPMDDHDLAYWTGNEVRLSITLSAERIPEVLRHEFGHGLNVYLIRKLGSVKAVRAWHDRLNRISRDEGYVSKYATTAPIENAAEVTRLYLYSRPALMLNFPRQFAFVHRAYAGIGDAS